MTIRNISYCVFVCSLGLLAVRANAQPDPGIPHFAKQGTATQLLVDGKPFVVVTGETEEETSTSFENMRPLWPIFNQMNLNTLLPVVYWGLFEPEEGKYDFTLVDALIQECRSHNLHAGLVWFASWKNGLSLYAPDWVQRDYKRFPRVQTKAGVSTEIFSSIEGYGDATRDADARAFAALLRHVKEVDGRQHTVILLQVENEVGISGDSRDRSPAANKAFEGPVPKALMDYLQKHKDTLIPEFRQVWEAAGFKTSGAWEEVFGKNAATDEIFEAWQYAQYVGRVAAAGKAEYPLPMYVNAALHRSATLAEVAGKPATGGGFAFGGPMADVLDVWRAAAPAVDMLSPDAYGAKDFASWCGKYSRSGNPLFIAESSGGGAGATRLLYALGQNAVGLSIYGVEFTPTRQDPTREFDRVARTLSQIMPMIVDHQGRGTMTSVLLTDAAQVEKVQLGDYTMSVAFGNDRRPGGSTPAPPANNRTAGALFIMSAPDEMYVVASNAVEVAVRLTPNTPGPPLVGVSMVEEGSFVDGRWVRGRSFVDHKTSFSDAPLLLPGAFHRIDAHSEHGILRVKLYRYQ